MRPIIEFCSSNISIEDVMPRLEENPEYDVVEYGCLNNCGQCYAQPYAMVNGEIVAADSPEALYDAIIAKIKEAEAWDSLDID